MIYYCCYCGRMQHRCSCHLVDSPLQRFLARAVPPQLYRVCLRTNAYKRGVPPILKHRERTQLKKNYATYYRQLVTQGGEHCQHCGGSLPLALDHIIPIAKGGKSELANLQLLCPTCNLAKGKLAYDCNASLADR